MNDKAGALKKLPSVDRVLSLPEVAGLVETWGRSMVTGAAREAIASARARIIAGDPGGGHDWPAMIESNIARSQRPSIQRVINLSGVISHTNLGRARLAEEAAEAAALAGSSNMNLEYDIAKGARGERDLLVEDILARLTGAEAATVVNNNAAAVLITLNTLAYGKRAVVSRGELIEIGGSFRLPDIMEKSGCLLHEVGTTNRTHLSDYEKAIGGDTALVLRAHTSNYKVIGFAARPDVAELAALCKSKGVPLAEDLGSGALIGLEAFGLPKEPTVQEVIGAGVDVATFSGDKLLGGPQAGIIVGRRELVDLIRKNPLKRALRPDKMILAALEATLRLYLSPEKAVEKIPTLRHLARPLDRVRKTAEDVAALLRDHFKEDAEVTVVEDVCRAGAGALPEVDIPSFCVAIRHKAMNPNRLAEWFRQRPVPVIGRVEDGLFRLDMRTLDEAGELDVSEWMD